MNLQTFTSFKGRIPRKTFWLGIIVLMIVQWILMMLVGGTAMFSMDPADPAAAEKMAAAMTPVWIIALVFLWPSLALYAKRWHDRNKSGWWSLIAFVPLIGALWLLIECGFLRGTDGPNRFGEDPLGGN